MCAVLSLLIRGEKVDKETRRGEWSLAVPYAVLGVLGQLALYAAMDRFAPLGRVAITYPIAVSVTSLASARTASSCSRSASARSALLPSRWG